MGQGTDADKVHPGLGDALNGVQRDPATGLERASTLEALHRLAHHERVHVVEHDDVRARFDRFFNFVHRLALDLDLHKVGRVAANPLDRQCDAPAGADVVVLDERAIEKAHPVVVPAPTADGVLLKRSYRGKGLPGVDDLGAGVFDPLNVLRGEGRDSAQVGKEVEQHPFRHDESSRLDRPDDQPVAPLNCLPVRNKDFDLRVFGVAWVRGKKVFGDADSADDPVTMGGDGVIDDELGIDAPAGDVSATDVLLDRIVDEVPPVDGFGLQPDAHKCVVFTLS